jgi:DNA polymerase-3 subunit gamma/tau
MSAALSLYRKYRSQTFDELVGQEPVVKTLKNAIATGRIGQAYLFTGPRGVGKTSAARLLARAANCLSTDAEKPCNKCANCLAAGLEVATDLIEIDAASNTGVDNIRDVIERAQFTPSVWHTKFYIIDEVHMLSVSAFNALLKTLEEPPPHVAFILATTEVHKVPATVASRCQRFDFRRVPLTAMVARLRWICDQEGIVADDDALELVARQATGSLRDALSLMDQLRVFAEGGITLAEVQDMLGASGSEQVADFVDHLVGGDMASGLRLVGAIAEEGLDVRQFNRQVVEHLRALMLVKSGAVQGDTTLIDVTAEIKQRLASQANKVSIPNLLRWIKIFADADADLRTTSYRQLPLELALVEAVTSPALSEQPGPAVVDAPEAQRSRMSSPAPANSGARPSNGSTRLEQLRPEPSAPSLPPPLLEELSDLVEIMPAAAPAPSVAAAGGTEDNTAAAGASETADVSETLESGAQPEAEPGQDIPQDELARLRKLWPALIEQLNARSKNVAGAFRDPTQVRPHNVSGKVVTISFRYPIQAKRSRSEPARGIIEQALTRTLGYACVLEAILFEEEVGSDTDSNDVAPSEPKGAKPKPPAPHETPRGKAVMNIFGVEKFEDQ